MSVRGKKICFVRFQGRKLFMFVDEFGKELAEPQHLCRDVSFGDDHGNRDDDHDDSRGKFRGERFSENRNSENDGSNGFQSSEDCCRIGVEPIYWMALVVDTKDMAVGKRASATMLPHRNHLEGTISWFPARIMATNTESPNIST